MERVTREIKICDLRTFVVKKVLRIVVPRSNLTRSVSANVLQTLRFLCLWHNNKEVIFSVSVWTPEVVYPIKRSQRPTKKLLVDRVNTSVEPCIGYQRILRSLKDLWSCELSFTSVRQSTEIGTVTKTFVDQWT